jgi:hypothetical protein
MSEMFRNRSVVEVVEIVETVEIVEVFTAAHKDRSSV